MLHDTCFIVVAIVTGLYVQPKQCKQSWKIIYRRVVIYLMKLTSLSSHVSLYITRRHSSLSLCL